jgi:hypothetical protein
MSNEFKLTDAEGLIDDLKGFSSFFSIKIKYTKLNLLGWLFEKNLKFILLSQ